jgi:hypothetical protein
MTGSEVRLTPIDADTACRVLAVADRRAIIDYLLRTDTAVVDFETLARHIEAHQESNADSDMDSLGVIVLELFHQHLPHLEAAGLIDFDSRSETVAATDEIERLQPMLDALEAI